ncbi:RNA-binding KH domain protein, putative [Medicago truncatula]|uniref:RNA-binding KH domain protein, putative n=1 Tax=Medicago truncatula TaxID=3880 RepID=G7JWA3_MEDTR|nr:RNA-binding KH domain protein, putative [Medicago truncatula]
MFLEMYLKCRFWDQISGADVTVFDPSNTGTSGGKVVISGTPDQTFAAQSLLQAFIQTAQAS